MWTGRLRMATGPLYLLSGHYRYFTPRGLRVVARTEPRKCWRQAPLFIELIQVDILNLILDGEAEYRDSDGSHGD